MRKTKKEKASVATMVKLRPATHKAIKEAAEKLDRSISYLSRLTLEKEYGV